MRLITRALAGWQTCTVQHNHNRTMSKHNHQSSNLSHVNLGSICSRIQLVIVVTVSKIPDRVA